MDKSFYFSIKIDHKAVFNNQWAV